MSTTPEVGKTYRIAHSRKGLFTGRVTRMNDEWVTVEVIDGKAKAVLDYNEAHPGDEVALRRLFCTFAEVAA